MDMTVQQVVDLIVKNLDLLLKILLMLGMTIEVTPIKISPLKWIGKRINSDITKRVEELEKEVKASQLRSEEIRMLELRRQILQFGTAVSLGVHHNKENYDDIFDRYAEYEELCKKHNFTNGKVPANMRIITDAYDYCIKNKKFREQE